MTSKLFNSAKIGTARTENGAVAHKSTLSAVVDLYQLVGSSRNHVENIHDAFLKAVKENKDLAVRTLLHARDIRGGMGERAVGRKMLQISIKHLSEDENLRIMRKVPEMGRWDDMLVYFNTKYQNDAFQMILAGLDNPKTASLVAKWLPREKKGNKQFVQAFCKFSGLTRVEYRKLCAQLSNTVEQKLCAKDYASINFSQVPSVAAARYQKVFHKVDGERYRRWIEELKKPQAEREEGVKVNAGAIYPYDALKCLKTDYHGRLLGDSDVAQAQWDALPDYMDGSKENILCMSDVSGSMTCEKFGAVNALEVGVSLSMYCAERNHGIFKDQVMVYSDNPYMIELVGSLADRYRQMMEHVEYGSTNIQKAFTLILSTAVKHKLDQEDLPTKVIIFSDMEFNSVCGMQHGKTNLDAIRTKFQNAGYKMPQLVFWHLASRKPKAQATVFDQDIAIVSGFSPAILKAVLGGEDFSPMGVVYKALMVERYDW